MKKKAFALIFVLCCILPLMLACGGEAGSAETTTDEVGLSDTSNTTETTEAAPPEGTVPPADTEPNAILFASADFQGRNTVGGTSASGTTADPSYNDGNAVASAILKRIIQNMKQDGYTKVDATLFCGDYDIDNGNKASDSQAGIDAIKAVYTEMDWNTAPGGAATTHIFLQGNHEEKAPVGTYGLSGPNRDDAGKLGVFDTEHYGLYLLHEDYHPFQQSGYTDQMIDDAAAELKEYLDAKLAQKETKPIFIAAHVPLHHNLWMSSGLYAKPFFDVINAAAEQGLNIIYLFGHDHGGYDQYLGGTDIFLPVGSTIIVPDRGTKESSRQYPLHFTYMSAGLNAYLIDDHSENQLSGTVFEIYDDRVVIKRYNDTTDRANNGLTNVGNVGEARPANTAAGLLHSYYPKEYPSPQVLTFDKQAEITDSATGVSVRACNLSSVNVRVGEPVKDGNIQSITYDIRPTLQDNTAYDGFGTVTLPLPASAFADATAEDLSVTAGGRPCGVLSYEQGLLSVWVPCFSEIKVTHTPTVRLTGKRVTAAELADGKEYFLIAGQVQSISDKYNKHLLSPEPFVLASPQRVGLAMVSAGIGTGAVPQTVTVDSQYAFTLTKDAATGNWLIGKDGQYLFAGANSGGWASSGDATYRVRQLKYDKAGTPFRIADHGSSGMVYLAAEVANSSYPCYMYVTSYGNTCLMDLPKDVTKLPPANVRISYYYLFEVQG